MRIKALSFSKICRNIQTALTKKTSLYVFFSLAILLSFYNDVFATKASGNCSVPNYLFGKTFTIVLQYIFAIGFIVFLALLTSSGLYWLIRRKDQEKSGKVKKIITKTIIGLVFITLAYLSIYEIDVHSKFEIITRPFVICF